MAVDNAEAGREFCQKFLDKGLLIAQDLPPLQGLEKKLDWNDIMKCQKELSLRDLIQSDHTKVIRDYPPPK